MRDDSIEDRDPHLLALFEDSVQELPGEAFVASVSMAIERAQRARRWRHAAVVGLLVVIEVLLNSPLSQGLGLFAAALETSLVPVETPWLELVLFPVNSLAGVVGLSLLALHIVYRRVVN